MTVVQPQTLRNAVCPCGHIVGKHMSGRCKGQGPVNERGHTEACTCDRGAMRALVASGVINRMLEEVREEGMRNQRYIDQMQREAWGGVSVAEAAANFEQGAAVIRAASASAAEWKVGTQVRMPIGQLYVVKEMGEPDATGARTATLSPIDAQGGES